VLVLVLVLVPLLVLCAGWQARLLVWLQHDTLWLHTRHVNTHAEVTAPAAVAKRRRDASLTQRLLLCLVATRGLPTHLVTVYTPIRSSTILHTKRLLLLSSVVRCCTLLCRHDGLCPLAPANPASLHT
jgi:hypothetical protein